MIAASKNMAIDSNNKGASIASRNRELSPAVVHRRNRSMISTGKNLSASYSVSSACLVHTTFLNLSSIFNENDTSHSSSSKLRVHAARSSTYRTTCLVWSNPISNELQITKYSLDNVHILVSEEEYFDISLVGALFAQSWTHLLTFRNAQAPICPFSITFLGCKNHYVWYQHEKPARTINKAWWVFSTAGQHNALRQVFEQHGKARTTYKLTNGCD